MSVHFHSCKRLPGLLLLCLLLETLGACAIRPFQPETPESARFLERGISKTTGSITVTAAVPDAEETLALTGLELYRQGIQPVWLKIENHSGSSARLATWSIDRDYFSPIEVAYMNRGHFRSGDYDKLQRWFHQHGLPRYTPSGEVTSGLVFTHLRPGTKGFNLSIFADGNAHEFTFFIPMPGFSPDFLKIDFDSLYPAHEVRQFTTPGALRQALEQDLVCCTTDPAGEQAGGPFNAVLIGTTKAVRRAMLRGGWLENAEDQQVSARRHYYRGRSTDAIFTRLRSDGNERIQIHIWMTPWRFNDEPLWTSMVYYYTDEHSILGALAKSRIDADSRLYSLFARESVSADIDSAQQYLLQNLWYSGSLSKLGFVRGMPPVAVDQPRISFGDIAYFTDGMRAVIHLSEKPQALDDSEFILSFRNNTVNSDSAPSETDQVPPPNDRIHRWRNDQLEISTAVPSAGEAKAIFDLDLYAKNVQPVWVQVENHGQDALYLAPIGLDQNYYSPREAANRNRGDILDASAQHFERRGLRSLSVPGESRHSGYIFTRVDEGTKSFNVDVISQGKAHQTSFLVPVPGLKIDHQEVNWEKLYPASDIQDVDLAQLTTALESMPCCVSDASGEDRGDPLNLVLVGEIEALYHAFLRAGWDQTETIYGASLLKTAASAISGGRYRYSPVSALYVYDRPQDVALQRARSSIHERNHLRLWLTPYRLEGRPVWIGQISRDIGVHFTWRTITTHKIDPDVDETREFLLEDLAFAQSIEAFGYLCGVGAAPYEAPRGNLTGDPYFTDGKRLMMWISNEPRTIDEIELSSLKACADQEPTLTASP